MQDNYLAAAATAHAFRDTGVREPSTIRLTHANFLYLREIGIQMKLRFFPPRLRGSRNPYLQEERNPYLQAGAPQNTNVTSGQCTTLRYIWGANGGGKGGE